MVEKTPQSSAKTLWEIRMTRAENSADIYLASPRFSAWAMAAIVAAHAALLVLLSAFNAPPLPLPTQTLSVHIVHTAVTPPAPVTPPAAPAKTTPTPVKPLPTKQPPAPILAAQTTAPAATGESVPTPPSPPASHNAPAAAVSVSQARYDAAYLHNPTPLYPSLSRRLGEEGKVLLHVHVDASGRPKQLEVKQSSGWPRLDQSALEAVARWKFVAARRGDEAVDAWVLVPIVFNLNT
jgi:protein TonB